MSSWSLKHNEPSLHEFVYLFCLVWMSACEGSSHFSIEMCPQNFYLDTRLRMMILQHFQSILWVSNQSLKFLEVLKLLFCFFSWNQSRTIFWVFGVALCSWWIYLASVKLWCFSVSKKTYGAICSNWVQIGYSFGGNLRRIRGIGWVAARTETGFRKKLEEEGQCPFRFLVRCPFQLFAPAFIFSSCPS